MTKLTQIAKSPKTFLDRDLWMCALLASGLPHVVICVGMRIGLHLRVKTGRCDPGYDKLAGELGMSKRSIYRMVAMLEHAKWLSVIRSGHHRENQFVLLRGDKALSPLRGDKALSPQNRSEVTNSDVRGDRINTSEVTPAVTEKEGTKKTTKRTAKKESDSAAVRFADENKGTPDERNLFGETESAPQAPRQNRGDGAFERFWAAYPRRVAKEAARKAFASAIKRGADPETLIAGAQRYAVERKDQDPKYTKHPATWLNGGCWEDELPGGAVIDQTGNLVAVHQPPPQQPRRTGYTAIADEMNEEIERGIAAGTHDAHGWEIWTR
jgi:hypothetical protein